MNPSCGKALAALALAMTLAGCTALGAAKHVASCPRALTASPVFRKLLAAHGYVILTGL
jgi:hypothetical protein